jgi:hypothetical protein
MELKIKVSDLKKILSLYYKKQDGIDSQIIISKSVENDRFGEECNLEIILKRKIRLFGEERTVSERLSKDEVKEAIKDVFKDEGYEVYDVTYDSGVDHVWEGYGMAEHQESRAYFRGVTVKIKEKVKTK